MVTLVDHRGLLVADDDRACDCRGVLEHVATIAARTTVSALFVPSEKRMVQKSPNFIMKERAAESCVPLLNERIVGPWRRRLRVARFG